MSSRVNSRGSRIPRLRRHRRKERGSPGEELSSTKTATSTKLFPSVRAMNLLLGVFLLNLPDLSWTLLSSPPKLFLVDTVGYLRLPLRRPCRWFVGKAFFTRRKSASRYFDADTRGSPRRRTNLASGEVGTKCKPATVLTTWDMCSVLAKQHACRRDVGEIVRHFWRNGTRLCHYSATRKRKRERKESASHATL